MPQYQVEFDPTEATQLVFSAAVKPGGRQVAEQTIYNRDPNFPLLVAFEDPHQQPDFTSSRVSIVDPLSSLVVNGTVDAWGCAVVAVSGPGAPTMANAGQAAALTAEQTITVDVIPTGMGSSGNPVAIAAAIVNSGLALAIAQQIATSGISLVGNPVLLYNGSITSTTGTPPKWGVSMSDGVPALYGCAGGNTSPAFDCAIGKFNTLIGSPAGAVKLFYNASQYPTSLATMNSDQAGKFQAALDSGHRMYLCYLPGAQVVSGGGYSGPLNQTSTDASNLLASVNALAALIAASTNGATLAGVVLYQEINDTSHSTTAAQFQAAYAYYASTGPSPLRPTYKVFACMASGRPSVWNTYVNSSITIDGLGVDYYGNSYNNGTLLDSGQNGGANVGGVDNNIAAIAKALSVPWGIMEIGSTSTGTAPSNTVVTNYLKYIPGPIVNQMLAGFSPLDCMWFDGVSTGTAPNVITSSTDFRIPLLQAFINQITVAPKTGIAAGATAVLPPITGSPIAGYGAAGGISYDITVKLTASSSSTVPFATVQLSWFNSDSLTAQPVAVQTWTLPAGATGTAGTVINGAGPQRGQFLQVQVTNLDTVQMSVVIQLNSTARSLEADDWWWDVAAASAASVTVPTFTLSGNSAPYSNQVAMESSLSVPSGGTNLTHLCGMFAGQVFVRFNGGTSGKVSVVLKPVPGSTGAGGTWMGGSALLNESPVGEFETIIFLPRSPVEVTFNNSDSVAHSIDFEMVALR